MWVQRQWGAMVVWVLSPGVRGPMSHGCHFVMRALPVIFGAACVVEVI